MRRMIAWLPVALSAAVVVPSVWGQLAQGQAAGDRVWTRLAAMPEAVAAGEAWIRTKPALALQLDRASLAALLQGAPMEDTPPNAAGAKPVEIVIPTPDGRWARFAAVESPVMHPDLQAKYPEIRTYWARGVDDPYAVARFDLTPAGFHAVVSAPEDAWTGGGYAIDPYTRGDDQYYSSYWRRDYAPQRDPFVCHTIDNGAPAPVPDGHTQNAERSGAERRTYRLAVSATGEFTAFHGGTVAGGLAAVTTMVNRITGVYETDVAIRLQLVANNDLIIYTNAGTDPFTSPGMASTANSNNQTSVDAVIGSANYDIGHVVHRGANNGLAGAIGNVCVAGSKAQGYTSTDPPSGDLLAIDYAAHEMGHQFAGRHTFNNCDALQGDSGTFAVEPGSGTTIMAYANICPTTNTQSFSDPDFHALNIDQIITYTTTGGTGFGCAIRTATGNLPPVVTVAQRTFNIPTGTPFTLTATATDPNGDPLTYDWDQMDGSVTQNAIPLTGGATTGPVFRSRPATASPTRSFPIRSDLLANSNGLAERVPTVARSMNFRCLVRDGLGGVADTFNGAANPTEVRVNTIAGGPFSVTAPNTNVSWSGNRTVTWALGGSNAAPVSCASVDILLSTDGGNTFPTVLASAVPNSGSANVLLPNIASSTARIMIRAVGNIFYDLSNTNFTIVNIPAGVDFQSNGNPTLSDNTGNGNSNGRIDPGESDIRLVIPIRNNGATAGSGVTGTLVSNTPTVTIVGSPTRPYPDLAALTGAGDNASAFAIRVDSSHPCGAGISLTLNVSSPQSNAAFNYSLTTGVAGSSDVPQNFNYSGPVVAIPDLTTVNVDFLVSGLSGPINDLNFRFGGSACSAGIGSTTVGLDHTFVGDLVISLRSPSGTVVQLFNRRGAGGNNLCNVIFDDAANTAISSITSASAPFTGTYRPEGLLSAFNGQNPNGTWRLTVQDAAGVDIGNIRAFSLIVVGPNLPPTCEAPIVVASCAVDFNADGFLNQEDLGGYIAAFLDESLPSGPSGTNAAPCPGEPAPYDTLGYAADYNLDCTVNQEDLGGFITEYLQQTESPTTCVPG